MPESTGEIKIGGVVVKESTLFKNIRMIAGGDLSSCGAGEYKEMLWGLKNELRGNADISGYLADSMIISCKNSLGLKCSTKEGSIAAKLLGIQAESDYSIDNAKSAIKKMLGLDSDEGDSSEDVDLDELRDRVRWDIKNFAYIKEYAKYMKDVVDGQAVRRADYSPDVIKEVLPEGKDSEEYCSWLTGISGVEGFTPRKGLTNIFENLEDTMLEYSNSLSGSGNVNSIDVIGCQLGLLKSSMGSGLKRYDSVEDIFNAEDMEALLVLYKGVFR